MRCSLGTAASTTARARAGVASPLSSSLSSSLSPSLSSPPRLSLPPSLRICCPPRKAAAVAASAASSSSPSPRSTAREQEDLEAFSPFLAVQGQEEEEGEVPSSKDPELAWRLLSRFTAADFAGRAPALLADPRRREALRAALRVVSRSPRTASGWFPSSSTSNASDPPAPPFAPPPPLVVAVLASSHELACRALRDYLELFGLPYCPPSPRIAAAAGGGAGGGVFVKVSASSLVALAAQAGGGGDGEQRQREGGPRSPLQPPRASPYAGKDRGVLLTLGDTQFGHLPLGLLDEERKKPAPALE